MKPLKLLMMGLAMFSLAACSKTVQWEEEVPLNTGETIIVKRSGSYIYKGLTSDGSAFSWVPEWLSTIEFTYKGKKYKHTDDAGLVLLAIGPDGVPNLVASPNTEWNSRHKFDDCVIPYYVQFRPDSAGKVWTWPERIDPWLYNLPTNLMFGLAPLESSGKKFTPSDRAQANAKALQEKHLRNIDPSYSYENICLRKN